MEFVNALTLIDYVVILVLIVSAILSTLRGMTREFLGLLGWFISIFVARISAPLLEPTIESYLSIPAMIPAIAWTIPFVLTVFIWFIVASIIAPGLKKAGLGTLDRWFGAFFGLLRGVLLVVMAYLGAAVAVNGERNLPGLLSQSVTADLSRATLTIAKPIIPSDFQSMVNQVREIDLKELAPDTPELIERGKDNVETGTGNITDQLELLEDEVTPQPEAN